MQSKHSAETISLNLNKGTNTLSYDEYIRWLCLLEGIELVTKKMKQYSHRLKNKDIDWIKPLAFQKYVAERFETMKSDLEEAEKNTECQLTTLKQTPVCTTSLEPVL